FGGTDHSGRVKLKTSPLHSYVNVNTSLSRAKSVSPRLLKAIECKFTRSDVRSLLAKHAPHTFMRVGDIVQFDDTGFVLSPEGFQEVDFRPSSSSSSETMQEGKSGKGDGTRVKTSTKSKSSSSISKGRTQPTNLDV